MIKLTALTTLLAVCSLTAALAAVTDPVTTTIDSVKVYSGGNAEGDILVVVATPHAGCPQGYWVDHNSSALSQTLSVLLSARVSKASVQVTGDLDNIWPLSGGTYCHIRSISY